jgi:hypothetical protein
MTGKIFIVFLIILFSSPNVFGKKKKEELVEHEGNIVVLLDKVYDDICDYSTVEFPSIFNKSIGNIIRSRMMYIIAILLLISISFEALKVLGNPNEDFSKYMFLKPIFLVLFVTFYPFTMGIVNSLAEIATFKDISEKTVVVTRKNIESSKKNYTVAYMPGCDFAITDYDDLGKYKIEYTETEVALMRVLRDNELYSQHELTQNIIKAKKEGRELSDDEKSEILSNAEERLEGTRVVRGFQSFTYWASDKVSLVMRIIQTVILSMLFIGGPIAIAMEIIFKGSLKKWFGIFIHTHLWTPVIFVIDMVALLINKSLNSYDAGGAATVITLVVQVVIIALYIIVAKMASNFIQSQEGGGVLGAMSYKTMQHLQAGSKILMGGSGGIAGAFKGTLKGGGK